MEFTWKREKINTSQKKYSNIFFTHKQQPYIPLVLRSASLILLKIIEVTPLNLNPSKENSSR